MAKILFTHSYFLRFDSKQWETQQPYPPLGTLYAASLLREQGHNVYLFDAMLAVKPEEINSYLREINPQYVVIYDDGFNYLTKMCLTNMREAAIKMIGFSKTPNTKIIVSSSDASDHPEKYLNAGADFILSGEGEITLSELIRNFEENGPGPEKIPGLNFLENNVLVSTPTRAVIRDPDNLPPPAWDLVDMDAYRDIWIRSTGYFSLNYATTRGCPFRCNWCAKPIYGNRYNSHSPERVVNDLYFLKEKYNFDHIWFCDDIFGLKPGWVQEFSQLLSEINLNFKYKIQSRADLLLKDDTIRALSDSGADEVWIGAESGSQKILDSMEKGITLGQIYESALKLKNARIKPCLFLQFGYLGEEEEDIRATIDMVLNVMPYNIGISVSYPLPGTGFYEKVKEELVLKSNWEESDDLDLMYQGNFSSEYYRKLQKYVHKRFRQKQGFEVLLSMIKAPLKNIKYSNFKKVLASIYYSVFCIIYSAKLKSLSMK